MSDGGSLSNHTSTRNILSNVAGACSRRHKGAPNGAPPQPQHTTFDTILTAQYSKPSVATAIAFCLCCVLGTISAQKAGLLGPQAPPEPLQQQFSALKVRLQSPYDAAKGYACSFNDSRTTNIGFASQARTERKAIPRILRMAQNKSRDSLILGNWERL